MMTNPYQPPLAIGPPQLPRAFNRRAQTVVVFLLFAIFCSGTLLSLAQTAFTGLHGWIAPRFGGGGLYDCAYPMIFLVAWLRAPHVAQVRAASLVCLAISGIHAVGLLWQGTVATVEYPYYDRLHSSWLYAVVPFLLAGIGLAWLSFRSSPPVYSRTTRYG